MWVTYIIKTRGFATEGRRKMLRSADRREREGTAAATTIESSVKTPRKKWLKKFPPSLGGIQATREL